MRRTDGHDTADRDYLSIREVLDLLVTEFPEVTISKIRFLESRGLIHPERTPSGYRKFYEGDVDRLRWILRQQREHFLPLKVIKGRLEGTDVEQEIAATPSLFDQGFESSDQESATLVGVAAAHTSVELTTTAAPSAPPAPRSPAPPTRSLLVPPTEKKISPPPASAPEPWPADPSDTASTPEPTVSRELAPSPSESTVLPQKEKGSEEKGSEQRHSAASARPHDLEGLNGASLSVEELASASGASPELLGELETFGLIASRDLAGEQCFDGDAVAIARAAAGFAAFGIEPRHLRSFKHAVERDATLLSQVVVPLLRQRNPEARARARRDLEALTVLSTALRQALLEIELRPLTGG